MPPPRPLPTFCHEMAGGRLRRHDGTAMPPPPSAAQPRSPGAHPPAPGGGRGCGLGGGGGGGVSAPRAPPLRSHWRPGRRTALIAPAGGASGPGARFSRRAFPRSRFTCPAGGVCARPCARRRCERCSGPAAPRLPPAPPASPSAAAAPAATRRRAARCRSQGRRGLPPPVPTVRMAGRRVGAVSPPAGPPQGRGWGSRAAPALAGGEGGSCPPGADAVLGQRRKKQARRCGCGFVPAVRGWQRLLQSRSAVREGWRAK